MPCLYFEPTTLVEEPFDRRARLPLIDEYDGRCHAVSGAPAVMDQVRWPCCNQGYSRGRCSQFPADGFGGALRYSVTSRSEDQLALVWIEERDYAPFRYGALHFEISTGCFAETGLDALVAAQALAYCRSYLKRDSNRDSSLLSAGNPKSQSVT